MAIRRRARMLAVAGVALSFLVGCSSTNDTASTDKERTSTSASASPESSSQPTNDARSNELPPAGDAFKPDGNKDVAREQEAADHGTPDPCRLFTGVQYSKVLGYDKPVWVKSHGGGPYYPDYRRNCYLVNEPGQSALTGELVSIHPDNGEITPNEPSCTIGPLGIKPPKRGKCLVINLDPYESGFDRNTSSANIPTAWIKQVRDQDGVLVTVLTMTTSDGYIAYATTYVEDAGRMLGLGRLMGNALREELGLNK